MDEQQVAFYVTDIGGEDGFGVAQLRDRAGDTEETGRRWLEVGDTLEAVEDDELTLRCGASKFNYTNAVSWMSMRPSGGEYKQLSRTPRIHTCLTPYNMDRIIQKKICRIVLYRIVLSQQQKRTEREPPFETI
jgi:hypothetical protein